MDQYLNESVKVESLSDLNMLYRSLVEPVRDIENKAQQRKILEQELKDAENTLNCRFVTPFVNAIAYTIAGAIPFIIVFFILSFFIKNGEGVRYFKVYDNWYGSTPSLHWLSDILEKLGESWGFIGIIIALIVSIALFFIIPAIVILLPLCFVGSVIYTVYSCIEARSSIKTIPGKLEDLHDEVIEIVDRIAPGMTFVPPDYRYSDALEFICRTFDNHKADSLKEALLQYDEFAHRREMESTTNAILQSQYAVLQELADQSSKLDSLKADISKVKDKVDWLAW